MFFVEEQMMTHGYPAYTTSCAWLGYSDELLRQVGTAPGLLDGLSMKSTLSFLLIGTRPYSVLSF